MTQQFNLPPGMVEAAAKAYYDNGGTLISAIEESLQAALEWAVKEGWAHRATAFKGLETDQWIAYERLTIEDMPGAEVFRSLILRLEKPKP